MHSNHKYIFKYPFTQIHIHLVNRANFHVFLQAKPKEVLKRIFPVIASSVCTKSIKYVQTFTCNCITQALSTTFKPMRRQPKYGLA